jgi:hypothetical protein
LLFDLLCGGKLFHLASPVQLEDLEISQSTSLKYPDPIISKASQRFSILCTSVEKPSSSIMDLVYAKTEPLVRRAEPMLESEVAELDEICLLKLEAENLIEV